MIYSILFVRRARRDFLSLPNDVQDSLERKIDKLAVNPRPHGAEKLSGEENLYRLRAGDYRIIYQIQDKALSCSSSKSGTGGKFTGVINRFHEGQGRFFRARAAIRFFAVDGRSRNTRWSGAA